jgi:hypothetical protein
MPLDDVKNEDRAGALRVLRDHLVETLKVAEPHLVAGLVKQLQSVLADLDRVAEPTEESLTDDLAQRRATRLANTASSSETGRRSQPRRKRSG